MSNDVYVTSQPFSPTMMTTQSVTMSGTQMGTRGPCRACERTTEISNRGLCYDRCDDLIPNHIPYDQHKRYRDRVILGKLPNTYVIISI
jgi:hypothetical protein